MTASHHSARTSAGFKQRAGEKSQALGFLRRFGSVSVLNGHIHQVMQKV